MYEDVLVGDGAGEMLANELTSFLAFGVSLDIHRDGGVGAGVGIVMVV